MPGDSLCLSQDECAQIISRVTAIAQGGGTTRVVISSWWNGELRWARNRVHLAGDRRDVSVLVLREVQSGAASGITNQLDDVSLEAVVRVAERRANERKKLHLLTSNSLPEPILPIPQTTIWSDATSSVTAETRGAVARMLIDGAEAKNMLSAGYLEMRASSSADSGQPDILYDRWTQAQCSMTVRSPTGSASGWAGASSFDWTQINGALLAQRALDKCVSSIDPVRIEPGRYTVVLEPQAVCGLIEMMMEPSVLARKGAEGDPKHPFWFDADPALRIGRSKIGMKIIDDRITIDHDPMDPTLGVRPLPGLGKYTLIERGVLHSMFEDHLYARWALRKLAADLPRRSFRMSGGQTTMDEMIKTTMRGILVTRFSHIELLDKESLLCTGLTRDGLWLIENGKISKAIKNFRFTESPLFALNQVEQLGVPVPVFRPVTDPRVADVTPTIVPPLKVRDFSFTSSTDAI